MEYKKVEKFLADLRKEFGKGDKETVKVAKLKRLEQRSKMIKVSSKDSWSWNANQLPLGSSMNELSI